MNKYDVVYICLDGQGRELSPKELEFINTDFAPTDSGRPYMKSSYESLDGWGNISGFIERQLVPKSVKIVPVNPKYDELQNQKEVDMFEIERSIGDLITKNDDGSITIVPNPTISREERFELFKKATRLQQEERERIARLQ